MVQQRRCTFEVLDSVLLCIWVVVSHLLVRIIFKYGFWDCCTFDVHLLLCSCTFIVHFDIWPLYICCTFVAHLPRVHVFYICLTYVVGLYLENMRNIQLHHKYTRESKFTNVQQPKGQKCKFTNVKRASAQMYINQMHKCTTAKMYNWQLYNGQMYKCVNAQGANVHWAEVQMYSTQTLNMYNCQMYNRQIYKIQHPNNRQTCKYTTGWNTTNTCTTGACTPGKIGIARMEVEDLGRGDLVCPRYQIRFLSGWASRLHKCFSSRMQDEYRLKALMLLFLQKVFSFPFFRL